MPSHAGIKIALAGGVVAVALAAGLDGAAGLSYATTSAPLAPPAPLMAPTPPPDTSEVPAPPQQTRLLLYVTIILFHPRYEINGVVPSTR
jgi:hypothetical protein